MHILCIFGQHNYGNPQRGVSYEYANLLPAFSRLGHEVSFFESYERSGYRDFSELNRRFLEQVERLRPDVIFSIQMLYEIWMETWEIVRDAGISATVNWTTDDSWKYPQFSRFLASAFHAITTTYGGTYAQYHKDGHHNVLLTQWAANAAALQPPLPARDCRYPVSFVGTAHGQRARWIADLRRGGIDVECFGHGWPRGPVAAAEIPQIIRSSVISLNFANSSWTWSGVLPEQVNQIKARTFEVPGAGGFLLSADADGLDRQYVPGREIVTFRTMKELPGLIRYYLSHPEERDRIASAGYERTCRDHTYDQRLSEVLEFALHQRAAYIVRQGRSPVGQLDWAKLEDAIQRHRLSPRQRSVQQAMTLICARVWGPVRGPRAARRFLFELSWRIAGAKTYTAAGLPGRMFYEAS